MSDNQHHGQGAIGYVLTGFSWVAAFISLTSLSIIPIILSSVASILACVNYYYQIRKNKK